MNKLILVLMVIGAMMTSCSSNGNKAETKAAEKVSVTKADATYTAVSGDSHVAWRAAHLGGVQPRYGKVFIQDAAFSVGSGTLSNASVTMNIGSLTVENFPEGAAEAGKLAGHLMAPDFFDVAKYPTAKFEMTSIDGTTGEYNSKVTGNLTILEVTKSITFNANVGVAADAVSVKSEDFTVDRTDWGLTYNTEGTAGVPVDYLVANDIGFTINVTLSK